MRALWVVAVLLPSLAFAAPRLRLSDAPTPVLGDHFRLRLPQGMKVEPRGVDIMSAPISDEDETRAVLDSGKARFVLMVDERYSQAPADLERAIAADASHLEQGLPVRPLKLAAPLRGFAAIPHPSRTPQQANPVYVAWLVDAQGNVATLVFYVNPDGMKDAGRWSKLADRIVATAQRGRRVLDLHAGERALGRDFTVRLPSGWVSHTQRGPDFSVYHLTRIVPLGKSPPGCGVYVGGFPSYFYRRAGIADAEVKQHAGTLLATSVTWFTWSKAGDHTTEAMAKTKYERVHVFCYTKDPSELDGLRAVAATLRQR